MGDLPPLNALRAFEATARRLSVTEAAKELHVTPGAVSHQVHALEEFLAVPLFERTPHGLILTPRGEEYCRAASRSLDILRSATTMVRQSREKQPLRIRAYTTFAMRWLIPRLSSFHSTYPSIEVLLTASLEMVDFSRDDLDGAIRLGNGSWPGLDADRLVPNVMAPVCSPRLLEEGPRLVRPADLGRHVLLHSKARERASDWADWLEAGDADGVVDPHGGLVYESSALAYQAAIAGQGLAMAQLVLVEDDLAAGRLVQPFARTLDRGAFTYYLVTPSKRRLSEPMTQFREWLLARCT